MSTDRGWMYRKVGDRGSLSRDYVKHLDGFLAIAYANKEYVERKTSEVYERVHCSNRKLVPGSSNPPTDPPQFIYPKAARMAERFRDLRDAAISSSQPDTPPPDDASLWEQSVGGRKKGRLFGFGISQDPYFAMTGECSNSTNRSSISGSQEVVALKEKMNEMEERHRVELEAEKKKREELENQQANQAARLAEQVALSEHFTAFMRQQGYTFPPLGPPAPTGASGPPAPTGASGPPAPTGASGPPAPTGASGPPAPTGASGPSTPPGPSAPPSS